MAVGLRIWRKSPVGFAKNGLVVLGRDIEQNKYKHDEIITFGDINYGCTVQDYKLELPGSVYFLSEEGPKSL
jgi:hypothetical protein